MERPQVGGEGSHGERVHSLFVEKFDCGVHDPLQGEVVVAVLLRTHHLCTVYAAPPGWGSGQS